MREQDKILLSFIIPAYNASSTIVRALDSIYALPLQKEDFEVIVVDDCSTDDTLSVLQLYAGKHLNMCVFHQEKNHRQGAARNWGVREARGEYVMFVDADDMVEEGVQLALKKVYELDIEVLACNYKMFINEYLLYRSLPVEVEGRIFSGHDFLENVYDVIVNTSPLSYLWKRNFLIYNNIPFVENRRMEDIDWIEKNLFHASRISYLNTFVYVVIGQPNSTTRTFNVGTVADWIHLCCRRFQFAEQHQHDLPLFYEKVLSDNARFVNNNTSLRLLSNFTPKQVCDIYNNLGKDALQTLRRHITSWQTMIFVHCPFVEVGIIFILYPLTSIGRKIYRSIKKKEWK